MNLMELMSGTLSALQFPTDEETLTLWRGRLTNWINEAQYDLAAVIRPWTREETTLVGGRFQTAALHLPCLKLLSVHRDGVQHPFYYGTGSGDVVLPTLADGTVTVSYRYNPRPLTELTDEPLLPEASHPLLMTYAVARAHCSMDNAALGAEKLDLSVYEMQKRRLSGGTEAFGGRLYNRY